VSVGAVVGICVGCLAILAAVARLLWATHRGLNLFEKLLERVDAVERTLNNGIRSKIDLAAERSARAEVLAADAARQASVASQHAVEGQAETLRAVNALRGEVDIYTNVVLTDRQRIRDALREMGVEVDEDE
jgi:hypothetical protein